MEWVETTGKTVDEARELALDQLGVLADEAEFEVIEEPRPGLFGRIRGEARIRARIRPTEVRPKQHRRGRDGNGGGRRERSGNGNGNGRDRRPSNDARREPAESGNRRTERDEASGPAPSVEEVSDAAAGFVSGLAEAFGYQVDTTADVDGQEIEVAVRGGEGLGLLIGPGGRTLLAIQDLARVAAQRRLGDHETRLRVDVAGYREKRRAALERFAGSVAEQVQSTGVARSLDPMPSADRKVIHDVLTGIDGVTSRSEGEEPYRRIVVAPG